jgi:hypothetical protein
MSFEDLSRKTKIVYLAIGITGLAFFVFTVLNGSLPFR